MPRVMEARGLDVTPGMIERFKHAGDMRAVHVLERIYQDEIEHVAAGSRWFEFICRQRDLEPASTFESLLLEHLHGQLRGPFNQSARLQAGFSQAELERLPGELY